MAAAEDKSGDNMKSLGWKFLNKETFGNGMEFKLMQVDFSKKNLISTLKSAIPINRYKKKPR